jgi:hypothetical protein
MFTKIAAMDETQKNNVRETKELFDALAACSKERDVRSIEARQRRQANQNARRATKRAGEQAHEGP